MLRGVVLNGTGVGLRDVPGPPVIAKTGTAEFDRGGKRLTHAWMIAGQGDLAVCAFVDVGQTGAGVAGPCSNSSSAAPSPADPPHADPPETCGVGTPTRQKQSAPPFHGRRIGDGSTSAGATAAVTSKPDPLPAGQRSRVVTVRATSSGIGS